MSTASPFSLVPFDQQACSTSVFKTVPPDCAVSRGNLFNHNQSSTWHDIGLYGINQNGVGLEANLGYQARVQFGLDQLAIGLTGPGVDNQTIGGIAEPEPFYLYAFPHVRPLRCCSGPATKRTVGVSWGSTRSHSTSPRWVISQHRHSSPPLRMKAKCLA